MNQSAATWLAAAQAAERAAIFWLERAEKTASLQTMDYCREQGRQLRDRAQRYRIKAAEAFS